MEIGRLNGIIGKLEQGKSVCVTFAPGDPANAQIAATEPYDGIVFEMEHGPYDIRSLRDCLQYLLNRRQLVESGSLAPAVTPLVRIRPATSRAGSAGMRPRPPPATGASPSRSTTRVRTCGRSIPRARSWLRSCARTWWV